MLFRQGFSWATITPCSVCSMDYSAHPLALPINAPKAILASPVTKAVASPTGTINACSVSLVLYGLIFTLNAAYLYCRLTVIIKETKDT